MELKVDPKYFALIALGKKTTEIRLNKPKFQTLKKGSTIIFKNKKKRSSRI